MFKYRTHGLSFRIAIAVALLLLIARHQAKAQAPDLLDGVVLDDASGSTIASAVVEIRPVGTGSGPMDYARTSTRPDGRFTIRRPTGQAIVVVSAMGFATFRTTFARMDRRAAVRLRRAANIHGVVLDRQGNPLDASLEVISKDSGNRVVSSIRAPQGAFALGELLPVATSIIVWAPGYAPRSASIVLSPAESLEVGAVTLRKSGQLFGVVVDTRGLPITGANLQVQYDSPMVERARLASLAAADLTSKGDGSIVIDNIVPDVPIRVAASKDGYRGATSVFVLAEGQAVKDVVIKLR